MDTTKTDEIPIQVLGPQFDFLSSDTRELLYSGAFGAGKTRAICIKAFMRACVPGAREGLCRKHLVSLKATTLKTLLEADGSLPPVIPMRAYTHNKGERVIRIKGGGEIYYFGMGKAEDYQKIASLNLSGCGIDEAVELTQDDWTMIRGRIRLAIDGLPNQLYGACNPGPPSHFLAERFGLALNHRPKENCQAITTRTIDNFYLPDDYVEDLKTLGGVAYKRYVLGQWVGSEGLVYDKWDRDRFVMERRGPWDRVIVGQDEGYTNPAVLLVVCMDSDGRVHVAHEWYRSQQLEPEVIEAAASIHARYEVEEFVIDPSAAKLRASMVKHNLPMVEADNEVFAGIQAVQKRLTVAGDGRPRLTVAPSCEHLIREFETYSWRQSPGGSYLDRPIKAYDHAMDALRYAIMHVDGRPMLDVRALEVRQLADDDEERFWH